MSLEAMRNRAVTGLVSGEWFSPNEANVGVELYGKVVRTFVSQKVDPKTGEPEVKGCSIALLAPTQYYMEAREDEDAEAHGVAKGETYTVELTKGEVVTLRMSGLLDHLHRAEGMVEGCTVYLRYEGVDYDQPAKRGNHPHSWTWAIEAAPEVRAAELGEAAKGDPRYNGDLDE